MISKFFIERPVLSNVIALLMILIGGVALFNLAIAQYPDVVPPTVQGTTRYPGASAKTDRKSTRLNSRPTEISTLPLHDALPILIGGVALFSLAIAQYPDVVPPTVQVTTRYPGASAKTVIGSGTTGTGLCFSWLSV